MFLLTAAPEMQQGTPAPEVATQEDAPVFQSKVTLIEVPVVVRDKKGKAVGTLRKEDFQLFDKGKPQDILKFSIEQSGGGKAIANARGKSAEPAVIAPDHFVGLLFDDIHITFPQLVYAREAAQKLVASGLKPADRVAIFTTSGKTFQDFTDDRDLLNKTLAKLALHPLMHATEEKCPTLSVYQADQMINYHNAGAIGDAIRKIKNGEEGNPCYGTDISDDSARSIALAHARVVLEQGRIETNANMVSLKDVVRKMAEMPGQRSLILASPGWVFIQDQLQDEQPAIDLAIKSGVVINALDVRGVTGAAGGMVDDFAFGTGGRAFHGNFLDLGLQELATTPEVSYLLGFSPQNIKLDGSFHQLKVTLKSSPGMSVQARLGYYAPDHLASADEDAKEEVTQALFSRDEMNDIPVAMTTQLFKASASEARLTVMSSVDVRKLHFRNADGRNVNSVRMVCALFDRDGNFIQASAKTIQLNLQDATLQNKLNDGIPVRSDFTVPPGAYIVRLVVRDAEGQTMTAQNGAVRIP